MLDTQSLPDTIETTFSCSRPTYPVSIHFLHPLSTESDFRIFCNFLICFRKILQNFVIFECSLDCVWQALGVEHVSLHSSLASHSAGSIFLIQRSLNVLQSANLYRASISTKIQCRSTDSFRLKETDLLREQLAPMSFI